MCGAVLQTYLLESIRVTKQTEGERNYHIFYQMCAAAQAKVDMPVMESLKHLGVAKDYSFLNKSSCTIINGVDDAEEFKQTVKAMTTVGFDTTELRDLFSAVASCLELGNLAFEKPASNPEASQVSANAKTLLGRLAGQLGVEPNSLEKTLCITIYESKGEGQGRTSIVEVVVNVDVAHKTRDILAQKLYGYLFLEIVKKVNVSIGQDVTVDLSCGILDIFGFECFEQNSFEQLCINFTNEELQRFVNNYVFRREADLYRNEGITFNPLDFPDNQGLLDLLSKKPTGVFPMIDEECSLPKGTDENFIARLVKTHQKNSLFSLNRRNTKAFIINHFAGKVEYGADQFTEKNRDNMPADCVRCLAVSTNPVVKTIFTELARIIADEKTASANKAGGNKKKRKTLASEFLFQMTDLMETMSKTEPHFIRCLKPTPLNKPNTFDDAYALEQMRSGGVVQAIEMSRTGFPVRMNHKDCLLDYRCLTPKIQENVTAMMTELDARFDLSQLGQSWAIGKNLAFLKARAQEKLDKERLTIRETWAVRLQARLRGNQCRKLVREMRQAKKK